MAVLKYPTKEECDARLARYYDGKSWFSVMKIFDRQMIAAMLDRGQDINEKDEQGDTALIRLIWRGNTEAVMWLLEHGADVNIRNNGGFTALDYMVQIGLSDIVEYSFRHMVNRDVLNQAFHMAIIWHSKTRILDTLLEHGADIECRIPDHIDIFGHNHTPLSYACDVHMWDIAEFLMSRGANIYAHTECHIKFQRYSVTCRTPKEMIYHNWRSNNCPKTTYVMSCMQDAQISNFKALDPSWA